MNIFLFFVFAWDSLDSAGDMQKLFASFGYRDVHAYTDAMNNDFQRDFNGQDFNNNRKRAMDPPKPDTPPVS